MDESASDGGLSFSYHERCNYASLLTALLILLGFELVALHLLLAYLWSPLAAWIFTALNIASGVWLIADYRASVKRPILLQQDALLLRIGLRWQAEVDWLQIESVRRLPDDAAPAEKGTLAMLLTGKPTVILGLSSPVRVKGILGLRQSTSSIGLAPDQPDKFAAAVEARAAGAFSHAEGA